jgi:hypothetical protein
VGRKRGMRVRRIPAGMRGRRPMPRLDWDSLTERGWGLCMRRKGLEFDETIQQREREREGERERGREED